MCLLLMGCPRETAPGTGGGEPEINPSPFAGAWVHTVHAAQVWHSCGVRREITCQISWLRVPCLFLPVNAAPVCCVRAAPAGWACAWT